MQLPATRTGETRPTCCKRSFYRACWGASVWYYCHLGRLSFSLPFFSPPEVVDLIGQGRKKEKKGPVEEERSRLLPSLETWLDYDCGRGLGPHQQASPHLHGACSFSLPPTLLLLDLTSCSIEISRLPPSGFPFVIDVFYLLSVNSLSSKLNPQS
jgi:hypothetical protein